MKTIQKYVAKDGSEWNDQSTAAERERIIDKVDAARAELKDTPDELNWKGYIQQDERTIDRIKKKLFKIAKSDGILKWWIDRQKSEHGKTEEDLLQCHVSWFGRMLDGGCRPLERAYGRLMCIDSNNREWNQPYYANNPHEGEQVCRG